MARRAPARAAGCGLRRGQRPPRAAPEPLGRRRTAAVPPEPRREGARPAAVTAAPRVPEPPRRSPREEGPCAERRAYAERRFGLGGGKTLRKRKNRPRWNGARVAARGGIGGRRGGGPRAAGAAAPRDACARRRPARPPALGEFKGARGASGHVGGAVQTWRGRGATLGGLLPPAARRSARGARRVGRGVRPRENRTPWRPLNARAAAAAPGCRGGSSPAPRPAGRGGASEPRNGPRSAGPAAAFAKRDKAPRRRPRRPPPGWALLSPPVRRRRAAGLSAIRGGRSGGCLFVRSACWLPPVTRGDAQFPELSGSGRRDRHRHERESPPLARPGPPVSSRRGRGRRRRRSDGDGARSGVAAAGQQV